jgi:[acyl-carrier-protein] S-malonyltransferase
MSVAATVGGVPVHVDEVDAREDRLRGSRLASSLPRRGTSEGRQLRRWLTQLLVTERVVAAEAATRGLTADGAPSGDEPLPDKTTRLEMGSIAASVLADPMARALFASVTAAVDVTDAEVRDYLERNPRARQHRRDRRPPAWRGPAPRVPAVARQAVRRVGRACAGVRAPRRPASARQHP